MRFDIRVNGDQVCMAGLEGEGALTCMLSYGTPHWGTLEFGVVGLEGAYRPPTELPARWVAWSIASQPRIGDVYEIVIRENGTFDPPLSTANPNTLAHHQEHAICAKLPDDLAPPRFVVELNGKRMFVAGLSGLGSLSTALCGSARRGEFDDIQLNTFATGLFGVDPTKYATGSWGGIAMRHREPGDILKIRILEAGEFDPPVDSKPSDLIADRDFGWLDDFVDGWEFKMSFDFPASGTKWLLVHCVGPKTGLTDPQRAILKEFNSRYAALWPAIGEGLLRCQNECHTLEELGSRLQPITRVNLQSPSPSPGDLELVYSLRDEPVPFRSYSAVVKNWTVASVSSEEYRF